MVCKKTNKIKVLAFMMCAFVSVWMFSAFKLVARAESMVGSASIAMSVSPKVYASSLVYEPYYVSVSEKSSSIASSSVLSKYPSGQLYRVEYSITGSYTASATGVYNTSSAYFHLHMGSQTVDFSGSVSGYFITDEPFQYYSVSADVSGNIKGQAQTSVNNGNAYLTLNIRASGSVKIYALDSSASSGGNVDLSGVTSGITSVQNSVNSLQTSQMQSTNEIKNEIGKQNDTLSGLQQDNVEIMAKLDEQSQMIEEQTQEEKAQTEELKKQTEIQEETKETTKGILKKITEFFGSFFDNLIDMIKGLIIPSAEDLTAFLGEVNDWFSERLGFIWYPFSLAVDMVEALAGGERNNEIIVPALTLNILGQEYTIWNEITVNMDEFGIFQYVRFFTSAILAGGVAKLAIDKWDEWIGGHGVG